MTCEPCPKPGRPGPERPEWVTYPGFLRLAALPHPRPEPCPGCQAAQGERHAKGCPLAPCPKCSGSLVSCGCQAYGIPRRYTKTQLLRLINASASMYHNTPTSVDIGSQDILTLAKKAQAFEQMAALKRASRQILSQYPRRTLERMSQTRTTPRIIEQAQIMSRQADRIWLDWFWR